MTREQAIQEIASLYPVDADYPETREIGIQLLEEAKRNTSSWRHLPDEVLFEYARLCRERCQEEERRRTR